MGYEDYVPPGLRLDISYATGFLVEAGIFGAYTTLFVAAIPKMVSARRLNDGQGARSAHVFLMMAILMYLVATIHLICAAFRFYKASLLVVDPGGPIAYLVNPAHWDFMATIIFLCIQTWLGDALVIYRCYFVWGNNVLLISIPVCLLLCSIGINAYVLWWLKHPLAVNPIFGVRLFDSIYPLALIQNFMTTSLIILKIYMRHRASVASGAINKGSALNLMRVGRIITESAMIYTLQILVLVILFFRDDNFQYVVQAAIVPSIGITFVLIALRIEAAREREATIKTDLGLRNSLPSWSHDVEGEVHCESLGPIVNEGMKDRAHTDEESTTWSTAGTLKAGQKTIEKTEAETPHQFVGLELSP